MQCVVNSISQLKANVNKLDSEFQRVIVDLVMSGSRVSLHVLSIRSNCKKSKKDRTLPRLSMDAAWYRFNFGFDDET